MAFFKLFYFLNCSDSYDKKYKDLIQSGQLTVIAGFYDFKGEFGKGMGNIVIVNVNKHKETKEMHNLPLFDNLSMAQKELHIGRLDDVYV